MCSREQRYRPEDCGVCHANLVGRRSTGFWEGGEGTRDRKRMSRKGEYSREEREEVPGVCRVVLTMCFRSEKIQEDWYIGGQEDVRIASSRWLRACTGSGVLLYHCCLNKCFAQKRSSNKRLLITIWRLFLQPSHHPPARANAKTSDNDVAHRPCMALAACSLRIAKAIERFTVW